MFRFYLCLCECNKILCLLGVGKRVPASAGKAKAGMVYSDSGWTWSLRVKLWDSLRTHAIPECLWGVFTTRRYTNPRLPLPYLTFTWPYLLCSHTSWLSLTSRVTLCTASSRSLMFWNISSASSHEYRQRKVFSRSLWSVIISGKSMRCGNFTLTPSYTLKVVCINFGMWGRVLDVINLVGSGVLDPQVHCYGRLQD